MEAKDNGRGGGEGVAVFAGEPPGNSLGSMFGAIGLGTFIACLGALFCFLLYQGYWNADETRGWTETPCVIERAWVEEGRKTQDSPLSFRFLIEYRYAFADQEFTSDRVKRVDGATSMRSKAETLRKRYPEGSETVCFVNPNAPTEAILKHDTLAVGYTLWFPGLFVIGGIGIVITGIRGWLCRRRYLAGSS